MMLQYHKGKLMANILVVDDEKEICNILELVLSGEGHKVFLAHDGKEALKRMYNVSPDIMILDIKMPGMNGYEVYQRVKQDPFFKGLPILFLSSESPKENELSGYDAETDAYITKPFKLNEIVAKVTTLIKKIKSPPIT